LRMLLLFRPTGNWLKVGRWTSDSRRGERRCEPPAELEGESCNKRKETLTWCTVLSKYVPHMFAYFTDLDFHLLRLQIYCGRGSYHTQTIFLCILVNIKYSLSWKLFEIKVEKLNDSCILST
jgi:hypothetical protein